MKNFKDKLTLAEYGFLKAYVDEDENEIFKNLFRRKHLTETEMRMWQEYVHTIGIESGRMWAELVKMTKEDVMDTIFLGLKDAYFSDMMYAAMIEEKILKELGEEDKYALKKN